MERNEAAWIRPLGWKCVQILFIGLSVLIFIVGCERKEHQSSARNTSLSTNEWKRFSSESGKFSVLFLGNPQETTNVEETELGPIEVHSFIIEVDIQNAYGVHYKDNLEAGHLSESPMIFDKCQALVVGENDKVMFQKEMKIEGFDAREFEFAKGGKANYSGRVRLILVGHRIYTLVTVFLTANPHPQERAAFFDSFLLKAK